jgi:hypothetical protein
VRYARSRGRSSGGPSGENTGARRLPVTQSGGTPTTAVMTFLQFSDITSLATFERPQQDSNLRSRLRRPLLSPLSYGGSYQQG